MKNTQEKQNRFGDDRLWQSLKLQSSNGRRGRSGDRDACSTANFRDMQAFWEFLWDGARVNRSWIDPVSFESGHRVMKKRS
jgi:hypothetical protein